MPEVVEYNDVNGQSPFSRWFWRLDARAAARVTKVILKLEVGLKPDIEAVGEGVFEARIHYGPGLRVYFGLDSDELVILVGGGDKSSQRTDIGKAKEHWALYKARKRNETRHGINP